MWNHRHPGAQPDSRMHQSRKGMPKKEFVKVPAFQSTAFDVPAWFLENCVKTKEELSECDPCLTIQEDTTTLGQDDANQIDDPNFDTYCMESAVYEQVSGLLPPAQLDMGITECESCRKIKTRRFPNDAAHLRFPGKRLVTGGNHFLAAVVQHFAQDAGVDLISLTIDDLQDLAADFMRHDVGQNDKNRPDGDPLKLYFDAEAVDPNDGSSDDSDYYDGKGNQVITPHRPNTVKGGVHPGWPAPHQTRTNQVWRAKPAVKAAATSKASSFPFSVILRSPDLKRGGRPKTPRQNLLVVYLPDAGSLLDIYDGRILTELRDAIKSSRVEAMVISTANQSIEVPPNPNPHLPAFNGFGMMGRRPQDTGDSEADEALEPFRPLVSNTTGDTEVWESDVLDATGTNPRRRAICVVPVRNGWQEHLFQEHHTVQVSHEQRNVRLLQRVIRQTSERHWSLPFCQPLAPWDFLRGTTTQKLLSGKRIDGIDVKYLTDTVGQLMEEDELKATILRLGRRNEALESWCESAKDKTRKSKWSSYPAELRGRIETIQKARDKLMWEQRFLDLLIGPDDVEEDWSSIVLDAEVKETIEQLVHQPASMGEKTHGILKRGRVGGALLYGPPGTGKTHLARVLAREAKAVTICVSPVDLLETWVGDTEKAIRALFNVGKMLAPSIIFIDEADALFRARRSGDKSWERNMTNQLLSEMDGLKRHKTPPFVLLATNFPQYLDHAVLRRVPSRLHIGLPNTEQRHEIFKICLRDEKLDEELDLGSLAEKAMGYSGSDIQTVCVQAALVCEASVEDSSGTRLLKPDHFVKAFQRSAATVSKSALADVKAFANEYDPAALQKMAREEEREQARRASPPKKQPGSGASQKPISSSSSSGAGRDGVLYENGACINCLRRGSIQNRAQKAAALRPKVATSLETSVESKPKAPPPVAVYAWRGATEMDPKRESSGSAAFTSARYTPLKAGSGQIRVLSFEDEPRVSEVGDGDPFPLRCSLRTVDLDDTTDAYRLLRQHSEDTGLSRSAKYRLAMWQFTSVCLRQRRQAPGGGEVPTPEDLFREHWSRLAENNDMRLEEIGEPDKRFNWGDYIALSYVWGSPEDKRDIVLNGQPFAVTRNLYLALVHLRDTYEVRQLGLSVWIDAICINQDDIKERAAEVKKMDRIYSECVAVRAWLGNPTPEVDMQLPPIREFLDATGDLSVDDSWSASERMGIAEELRAVAAALCSNPYWERMWIIQEVALAPSLLFAYGRNVLTTADVVKICRLFGAYTLKDITGVRLIDGLKIEENASIARACIRIICIRPPRPDVELSKPQIDLVDLVRLAQSSKATEPRDKVYALLALLPDGAAAKITPSYDASFSLQRTFMAFSRSYFEAEGDLSLLARIPKRPYLLQDLPSWAIDLDARRDDGDLTMTAARFRNHDANRDLVPGPLGFSDDGQLLSCEGVVVDSIGPLGAFRTWNIELNAKLHFSVYFGDGCPEPSPEVDWRLVLARVLMHDSRFEFPEDAPSVLDLPWIDEKDVHDAQHEKFESVPYLDYKLQDRRWARFYHLTPLRAAFDNSLYGNENFDVGGKPLKSYFTSTDELCPDPAAFMEISHQLRGGFGGSRLLMTRSGLLGSGPIFAQPGDKIAVLSRCDMPVVLRQKGDNYEILGSCFVEGLMKGEAASGVASGRFEVETFSLC